MIFLYPQKLFPHILLICPFSTGQSPAHVVLILRVSLKGLSLYLDALISSPKLLLYDPRDSLPPPPSPSQPPCKLHSSCSHPCIHLILEISLICSLETCLLVPPVCAQGLTVSSSRQQVVTYDCCRLCVQMRLSCMTAAVCVCR